MGKRRELLRRVCDAADLQDTPLPNQPLLEVVGCTRAVIENHRGVVRYDSGCICVKVGFGQISLTGCELELTRMHAGQLVITGTLEGICLLRGD